MVVVGSVIGYREVNYTNREGRQVNGRTVYFTFTDNNTIGNAADSVYLSNQSHGGVSIKPDDVIRVAVVRAGGQVAKEFIERVD